MKFRRQGAGIFALLSTSVLAGSAARADDEPWKKLPPGPVRDRIELMEEVGSDAKAINDALKAGTPADAAAPASEIAKLIGEFDALFPEGSTAPESRARAEIWTSRDHFLALSNRLREAATDVATAARDGGDVKAASRKMFGSCKSCHEKFRISREDG